MVSGKKKRNQMNDCAKFHLKEGGWRRQHQNAHRMQRHDAIRIIRGQDMLGKLFFVQGTNNVAMPHFDRCGGVV
jgi:hypothetical protein